MDEHTQGEELAFATEGSIVTEKEIKEMEKPVEVDFPMPGEIPSKEDEEEHFHGMPESVEFLDEEGKDVIK